MSKEENRSKSNSLCMHLFEVVFKHLIYVFVFVFVFSFIGMGYIILNDNEDAIFDQETDSSIHMAEWFLNHNPIVYGLKNKYVVPNKKSDKKVD
jgi:hypothetical protein